MESPEFAGALIQEGTDSIYFIGGVAVDAVHSSAVYQYTDQWVLLEAEHPEILGPRASSCGFTHQEFVYVYGGQDESIPKTYRN